jgi:hypothetical protein
MRIITNCLLTCLVISISLLSCQKEVKNDNPGTGGSTGAGTVVNPTPVQGTVTGKVVDNSNNAVAGATVKAGSNTTTTDSRGLFRFNNIQLDKYSAVITVEKSGFFKGYRVFSASPNNTNFVKLKLVSKTLIGSIDAVAGGSVSLPDNSKITLPASGIVVRSNNQSYSGSVKVYAEVIDPASADIAQIVPGSFQGTDAANNRVTLKSYGMLAVELEGNSGEQLQIAAGKTAKLKFTIPSSLRSTAPATIPLWSVDETTGLWKQEGNATKGTDYYEGDVSHFSFWNCDVSTPTIFLELNLKTVEGSLPFTQVKITRVNSGGATYGYTDSTGHVGGLVPKNEPLLLEVFSNCNQPVFSQNIGPYSSNTNLGTITVTIPPINYLQITGSAVNCSNQPVINGNAMIYYDGHLYNKPISNGSFSLTVTRCSNSNATIEVVVVDNIGNEQSSIWSGSASSGTASTGTLSACGTSSVSFFNYTLDGTNYSLSTATTDSFFVSTGNATSQPATLIMAFKKSQPNINIDFYTQGGAVGTFPVMFMTANQYGDSSITLVTPFNVTFTSYGIVGQFIEGSFTGQFREILNNNLHNVSATFRVRRSY